MSNKPKRIKFTEEFKYIVVLITCLCILSVSYNATAGKRGINVIPKKGKSIYLYKAYHALVVGASNYTEGWPDLPGALKDAKEVAVALNDFGFITKVLIDPTSQALKKALRELAFKTGKEANRALLFYFAGHGETVQLADGTKLGYIIPSDCPIKNSDPMRFDDLAISMKEIEEISLKAHSKHVLMVFDSCFSGSLFSLVRAAPVEITEKSAKPVRQFITAGGEGEQVPDKSVFKHVFLEGIKGDADLNGDGYVTGSELGMHIQGKVVNYSRGGQHPQYGKINNPKLDKGDFIFVQKHILESDSEKSKQNSKDITLIANELKKLREERKKSEALALAREEQTKEFLKQMKQLFELKEQIEKTKAQTDKADKDNQQIKNKEDEDTRVIKLEAQYKSARDMAKKEAKERRDMEQKLKKLQAKLNKNSEQAQVQPITSASDLKLAVFPIHISPNRSNLNKRFLNGIDYAIYEADLFKKVFTYYPSRLPGAEKILRNIDKRKVWKRPSFFSDLKPNVNAVIKGGKKLGVDAILLCYFDVESALLETTCYLFDIRNNKQYIARNSHKKKSNIVSFTKPMRKVFSDYNKYQHANKNSE